MSDQSFGKAKRLLKNWEFRKVYAQGHKKALEGLSAYWLKVSGDGPTRVGLSVGRKVANAVKRNKVKRRLRELMRTYPQPLGVGYWLVLSAKPGCAAMDYESLKKNLYPIIDEVFKK